MTTVLRRAFVARRFIVPRRHQGALKLMGAGQEEYAPLFNSVMICRIED
jgi:hypothetical protein